MKRRFRSVTTVVLTVLILLSVICIAPIQASALSTGDVVNWMSSKNGTTINDGGTQCVAAFNSYLRLFGFNNPIGMYPVSGAKDIFDYDAPSGWEKIWGSGNYRVGDVVIWDGSVGRGWGHVGMVYSTDNGVEIFDQNWVTKNVCGIHSLGSTGAIRGVFRPPLGDNNFPGEEDTSWNVPVWKTANAQLNTYNDWGTQESNRWIDAGDNCYIEKVYTNGFAHVMYPTSNGDRWAYAYASGFSLEKKLPIPTGSQTISDGQYHVTTVLDESKALDVFGAFTDEGTNIDIFSNLDDENQVFDINYIGDGCYTIINHHSGKALDCYDNGTTAGTNVQQWRYGGGDNQKWIIQETGDGESYYIISKSCGLYLDVQGGVANDGTNVHIYTPNQSNAQKWKFVTWGKSVGRTVSDGDYHISSMANRNYCLDVYGAYVDNGTNIQLYPNLSDSEQIFTVTYLGDGYYKIIVKKSGKSLDLSGAKCVKETNIQQWDYSDEDHKKWIIKPTPDGTAFNIISKKGGLCVDIYGGYIQEATNIQGYIANGTTAQQWRFVPWKGDDVEENISEGEYRIVTAVDESKALDVAGALTENRTNVQIYDNLNDAQQTFMIKQEEVGFYSIWNTNANKALDVYGDYCVPGTNVLIYDGNNKHNQQWMFKPTGDGFYKIISRSTGLTLDVYGGYSKDGTNVQAWTENETDGQKWKLRRVLKPDMVEITDVVVDHGEIKPIVSVSVDDKTLVENTDYTVSTCTENNKTYVKVVGIGDYCDSVSVEYTKPKFKIGDTNLDGIVSIRDVTAIQRHIAELEPFTEDQLALADTNGDGEINISDATHLQMYLAEYDVVLGKQPIA